MSDVKRYTLWQESESGAELEPYQETDADGKWVLASAYTALLAERDEMRKYAERYQWLRNNWFRIYGRSLGERGICLEFGDDWNTAGKPEHVDAAIDQAMQGEQP